jgi:hypothetical protein
MIFIYTLSERMHADTSNRFNKRFPVQSQIEINPQNPFHGIGNVLPGNGWAEPLAEGCLVVRRPAECDLVPLLALFLDTEDTDVADVMMATGINAARHLQPDLTQVV